MSSSLFSFAQKQVAVAALLMACAPAAKADNLSTLVTCSYKDTAGQAIEVGVVDNALPGAKPDFEVYVVRAGDRDGSGKLLANKKVREVMGTQAKAYLDSNPDAEQSFGLFIRHEDAKLVATLINIDDGPKSISQRGMICREKDQIRFAVR